MHPHGVVLFHLAQKLLQLLLAALDHLGVELAKRFLFGHLEPVPERILAKCLGELQPQRMELAETAKDVVGLLLEEERRVDLNRVRCESLGLVWFCEREGACNESGGARGA